MNNQIIYSVLNSTKLKFLVDVWFKTILLIERCVLYAISVSLFISVNSTYTIGLLKSFSKMYPPDSWACLCHHIWIQFIVWIVCSSIIWIIHSQLLSSTHSHFKSSPYGNLLKFIKPRNWKNWNKMKKQSDNSKIQTHVRLQGQLEKLQPQNLHG